MANTGDQFLQYQAKSPSSSSSLKSPSLAGPPTSWTRSATSKQERRLGVKRASSSNKSLHRARVKKLTSVPELQQAVDAVALDLTGLLPEVTQLREKYHNLKARHFVLRDYLLSLNGSNSSAGASKASHKDAPSVGLGDKRLAVLTEHCGEEELGETARAEMPCKLMTKGATHQAVPAVACLKPKLHEECCVTDEIHALAGSCGGVSSSDYAYLRATEELMLSERDVQLPIYMSPGSDCDMNGPFIPRSLVMPHHLMSELDVSPWDSAPKQSFAESVEYLRDVVAITCGSSDETPIYGFGDYAAPQETGLGLSGDDWSLAEEDILNALAGYRPSRHPW